jgi:hypothetical protein
VVRNSSVISKSNPDIVFIELEIVVTTACALPPLTTEPSRLLRRPTRVDALLARAASRNVEGVREALLLPSASDRRDWVLNALHRFLRADAIINVRATKNGTPSATDMATTWAAICRLGDCMWQLTEKAIGRRHKQQQKQQQAQNNATSMLCTWGSVGIVCKLACSRVCCMRCLYVCAWYVSVCGCMYACGAGIFFARLCICVFGCLCGICV